MIFIFLYRVFRQLHPHLLTHGWQALNKDTMAIILHLELHRSRLIKIGWQA